MERPAHREAEQRASEQKSSSRNKSTNRKNLMVWNVLEMEHKCMVLSLYWRPLRAQRTTTFSMWTYICYKFILLDGFGWGACHWNIGPFNARAKFSPSGYLRLDVTYWIRLRMLSLLWRWLWLWQLFLSFYFADISVRREMERRGGGYPTTLAIHILERHEVRDFYCLCNLYIDSVQTSVPTVIKKSELLKNLFVLSQMSSDFLTDSEAEVLHRLWNHHAKKNTRRSLQYKTKKNKKPKTFSNLPSCESYR